MAGSWVTPTYYQGDNTDESVTGTDLAETYQMEEGQDAVNAGGGNDYVDGGLGSDTLHGNAGNDRIFDVNSYDYGYSGLIGHDALFGDQGDDNLVFNSVDTGDIANGGSGVDLVTIDFASFISSPTTDGISFALGDNTACYVGGVLTLSVTNCEHVFITGSDGADTFTGGNRDDTLVGGKGNDTLQGAGGDDRIDPGQDSFYADGGAGVDILVLNATDDYDPLSVALSSSMTVSGAYMSGTANNFEQMYVLGGHGADTLTGGKLSDTMFGGDGDNQISGGAGDDILGTGAGRDTVHGGLGNDKVNDPYYFDPNDDNGDVVYGDAGDDALYLAGATAGHGSYVDGGIGNDYIGLAYRGDANSSNTILGGDGVDTIVGGAGKDVISGGDGNDNIAATTGAGTITGGSGDDIVNLSSYTAINPDQLLDGGAGNDELALSLINVSGTLKLNDPDKTVVTDDGVHIRHFERFFLYYHAADPAHIITGDGADTVEGSTDNGATIDGGGGNDTLYAYGSGAFVLSGGAGDDRLQANTADVKLFGGDGADTFLCYGGAQTMVGGAGADTFLLTGAGYSTVDPAGRHIIADFSHRDGDKINLATIDADPSTPGVNDAFHLVSAFGGHAGELVVLTESPGHYLVEGDTTGDGTADFAMEVDSHKPPVEADFVL